jgi:Zn-dependent protease with chaperone function
VLWVPYRLLRKAPRRWWLMTSACTVPFIVFLQLVQPIWIDPLFNEFGPMKDKALETDILALAQRAGIEGSRVFEVNKSVDTKAVNAYVTGFLDTKRIVLWDTLLAKLARDEVLFVMGHEMGHYLLGHVWKLILVMSAIVLVTLYAVHRGAQAVMARFRDRFGFTELADVASLPLLLLFFQVSTLVLMPPILALSRHFERESDRFGLELVRHNRAAATAFVKLQHENLGNPRPGWVYTLWRASHPPLAERIEFCNTYRPWATGEPLRSPDRGRGR